MTLRLLTLDEAVKAVMEKKSFGAHVFYYPKKDYFIIVRDSRNGQYAAKLIREDLTCYHVHIHDEKANRRRGRPAVFWSVSNVVHELVTILEDHAHSFSMNTASIIYQDVAAEPIFDETKELVDEMCS